MRNTPKLSKNVNKDVVLCETTNKIVSNRASKILLEGSVPFSKAWKRVPLLKRKDYNGASQVCVISINRTQYGKARRVLSTLEDRDYNRLIVNMI